MPVRLIADVGQWPTFPDRELQDALGDLFTNPLGTLCMFKIGITKMNLFFNCFLLFLDPDAWRPAAPGSSCAQRWQQCCVPTWLAAGENVEIPEANDCLVMYLHANLQLMCNMMYLTALVWFCFFRHKQECLTAQLMQLTALGLHGRQRCM